MTTHERESAFIFNKEQRPTSELIALMARYQDQLVAFLVVLLHDRDAALDCMQDTFLRAYQHLEMGKRLTGPWLYTVARNRAMDELKRRRRLRLHSEEWEAGIPDEGEAARAVRRALASLPPSDRQILVTRLVTYMAVGDGCRQ